MEGGLDKHHSEDAQVMKRRQALKLGLNAAIAAFVAGGVATPQSEALAQQDKERPIDGLKRIEPAINRYADVFPTLSVVKVIAGASPEARGWIEKKEGQQKEMFAGVVERFKIIMRKHQLIGDHPSLGGIRDMQDHALDLRGYAGNLIDDEVALNQLIDGYHIQKTPQLVDVLNQRKRIINDTAVAIRTALPDISSTTNILKRSQ